MANDQAKAAADAIISAKSYLKLSVGGSSGAQLEPTVFDRLSVERRVLGHITDEVDVDAFGSRNTLHALAFGLFSDPNTTSPQVGSRLEVEGLSDVEQIQIVLEHLNKLVNAGLVEQREDGAYEVTEAGRKELAV